MDSNDYMPGAEAHPDDSQADLATNALEDLRRRAEAIARQYLTQPSQSRELLSPDETRKQLHELRVHQIELEIQNEELRRTQLALDHSQANYFDLFNLAPVGFLTVSEQGLIQQANLTAAVLLDVPRGSLMRQPVSRFIFKNDQDRYYLFRKKPSVSGELTPCELRMVKPDGKPIWVQLAGTVTQDANGASLHRLVLSDITLRLQAQEQLRINDRALKSISQGVLIAQANGRILSANDAFSAITGYSEGEILGRTCRFIQGPLTNPQTIKKINLALRSATEISVEVLNYRKDFTPFWNDLTISPVLDEQGVLTHFLGIIRDITERKRTEQALLASQVSLRESALHNQTILDNMVDGVITIDMQGQIETINQAASKIWGYAPVELLGRNISVLMPEPYRSQHDGFLQHFRNTGEARILGLSRELQAQRKDGNVFPINLSVSKIEQAGQPTFVAIVRDITQHQQDMEEIRRLAFYDALTGLPNRRLLLDRLKQAMLISTRTQQHAALMYLDLDYFKRLNDALGHNVGDELLRQVAERLKRCVREGDSVARMGGDEFILLLGALSPQVLESAAQVEAAANKILETLGQPYQLHEQVYTITPSIGIVVFMGDREDMEELLKKSDVAMYQAKAAGRNTARFFDPAMQAAADARTELEKDMRRDLALNKFELYYQLQVNNVGAAIGVEALVRWNHPQFGLMLPLHFIPMAEETGLILPLGQWVLETACTQLAAWAHQPETATWIMAVNVSAHQFAQADFVAKVASALKMSGAQPHLLKLELTESMLLDNVEDVIVKMNEIKHQGVCFSLDDFGTGYSSLYYLKRLPLDQLKIDQSFVHDVLINANDAVIARTVVALGHSLGLNVLAEGVETAEQRDFLTEIGCDAFQGYYFKRPVSASELALFITKTALISCPTR